MILRARAFRGRVHAFDRASVVVLRHRVTRAGFRQADRAGVLLHRGYAQLRRGVDVAGNAWPTLSSCSFSFDGYRTAAQRWPPTAIACFFDFFALFIIFRLRHGALGTREIAQSFSKIFAAAGIMGIACGVGIHYTTFAVNSRFLVQLGVFAAKTWGPRPVYLGCGIAVPMQRGGGSLRHRHTEGRGAAYVEP